MEVQVDNTWGMLALENYRKIIVGGVSRRGPPASRVSLGTVQAAHDKFFYDKFCQHCHMGQIIYIGKILLNVTCKFLQQRPNKDCEHEKFAYVEHLH